MKLRSLLTLALAAAFVFVAPMTAKADVTEQPKGWQEGSKGWWYEGWVYDEEKDESVISYYADGVHPCDDLTTEAYENDLYYFDKDGWMQTGWINHTFEDEYKTYDYVDGKWQEVTYKNNQSVWYYANEKGVIQTDWQFIDGEWYYFSIYDGRMYEDGTYDIYPVVTEKYEGGYEYKHYDYDAEPTAYHFARSGEMTTDWYYHEAEFGNGGTWYYSNANGAVQTGWQLINGTWYFFEDDGNMVTGRYNTSHTEYVSGDSYYVTGDTYFFTPDGAMIEGWYNYAPDTTYGNWVYCEPVTGKAHDGWLSSGSDWYYLDDGYMRSGEYYTEYEKDADGNETYEVAARYYLGLDGKMITGWYYTENEYPNSSSNSWKYANADGTIEAQWVKSGSDWYFVNESGNMVRSGSYTCETEYDKAPERKDYNSWDEYYAARFEYNKSHTYIFDDNGKMVTNSWYKYESTYETIWYYADANGNGYNGWLNDGGTWYFINYGQMVTNSYVDGGYWVGADGVWR